ncbi:VOC family protein [Sphingobium estronivorans]|uniref:VOC family protein n=1 Tax=Sphingobium estronivorans TaxID=1577690 RepID=UPI00123AB253|nr:VOC family protein [Sphingobium estronivorans]
MRLYAEEEEEKMITANMLSDACRLVLPVVAIAGLGGVSAQAEDGGRNTAPPDRQGHLAGKHAATAESLPPGTFQAKQIVRDLDRSAAFYQHVFGIVPAMRFKSVMNHRPMEEILFKFPDGGHVPLVLIKFLDDGAVSHDQTVHVFFTDDIDGLIERVVQNGGQIAEQRNDRQHRALIAFWHDLEGNLLETVQMY